MWTRKPNRAQAQGRQLGMRERLPRCAFALPSYPASSHSSHPRPHGGGYHTTKEKQNLRRRVHRSHSRDSPNNLRRQLNSLRTCFIAMCSFTLVCGIGRAKVSRIHDPIAIHVVSGVRDSPIVPHGNHYGGLTSRRSPRVGSVSRSTWAGRHRVPRARQHFRHRRRGCAHQQERQRYRHRRVRQVLQQLVQHGSPLVGYPPNTPTVPSLFHDAAQT